ncbi:hypothetical protein VR41_10915 [Streptomyces sp. NRRL B-1568]|nr:hypothetical protein VR41_10915 [Streptomyces sp. NRRL B-1568]
MLASCRFTRDFGPQESYQLATPATLSAPRLSRDFIASVLDATGHSSLIHNARICVSDLVTNVVQHARGSAVAMEIGVGVARVVVAVLDAEPNRRPFLRFPRSDDERGRGLMLVKSLASDSGVTLVWEGLSIVGKAVWFELRDSSGQRPTGEPAVRPPVSES